MDGKLARSVCASDCSAILVTNITHTIEIDTNSRRCCRYVITGALFRRCNQRQNCRELGLADTVLYRVFYLLSLWLFEFESSTWAPFPGRCVPASGPTMNIERQQKSMQTEAKSSPLVRRKFLIIAAVFRSISNETSGYSTFYKLSVSETFERLHLTRLKLLCRFTSRMRSIPWIAKVNAKTHRKLSITLQVWN